MSPEVKMRAYVNVETVLEDYVRVAHFVPVKQSICVGEELSVGFESVEMMTRCMKISCLSKGQASRFVAVDMSV
jgi:hypothetical protein